MQDFVGAMWQHYLDEGEAAFVEARDHGTEREADQAYRRYRERFVEFSFFMDQRDRRVA